ncbi:5-formyltetrahydrofolate cyclo-ligase [Nioella nitratireducens]|uniref:5-formyltetrahydrofolate cyclo-ligase n=1 Tax=Nioella nitratireducens TaxID=1287720 RepID=UPI0008FD08F0|nr:5-formyltetrahydrofolate cyclo-ligase [Nioella nitratireducens]
MDLTEQKAALRKAAFAARAEAFGIASVADANAALLQEIGPVKGRVISAYMAMRTELDPSTAMTELAQSNRICVPVIAGKGLPLTFREWTPGCEMADGPFGARVPATGDWLEPEILIAPLVAFDADCNRLGYGGGFYDRTLERLRGLRPTRAIGFAYAAQRLDGLVVEPTDQRLDAVVTETGIHRPLAAPA